MAGVPSQLQLLLADSQRIGVTSGGAVVTARLWQGPAFVPASIMDHSNGSVSIDFLLQAQGDYLVSARRLLSLRMHRCLPCCLCQNSRQQMKPCCIKSTNMLPTNCCSGWCDIGHTLVQPCHASSYARVPACHMLL